MKQRYGSNGLTSARHDVFQISSAEKISKSFDAAVPEELVFSDKIDDYVEHSPIDAGDRSTANIFFNY